MKKLLVFVGDGGSGKTTLIAELVKRYPTQCKKLVTCTSRLQRKNEVKGIDYHFHEQSYFTDNPELALVKRTERNDYYGTRLIDLKPKNFHALLTLRFSGVQRLVMLGLENVTVVNISISQDLKIFRMRLRGDSDDMINERVKIDNVDRKDVSLSHFPIIWLNATDSIDVNVERIVEVF